MLAKCSCGASWRALGQGVNVKSKWCTSYSPAISLLNIRHCAGWQVWGYLSQHCAKWLNIQKQSSMKKNRMRSKIHKFTIYTTYQKKKPTIDFIKTQKSTDQTNILEGSPMRKKGLEQKSSSVLWSQTVDQKVSLIHLPRTEVQNRTGKCINKRKCNDHENDT